MPQPDAQKVQRAIVADNRAVAPDIYLLRLEAPEIAVRARAGQFVMVRVAPDFGLPLKRPFSFCRLDPAAGCFEIVYQVVGKGTAALVARRPGERVEVVGPLGNGFRLESGRRIGLVGGGLGIAPLLAAGLEIARHEDKAVFSFLGARSAEYLLAREQFAAAGPVVLATDDGSVGFPGPISEPLRRQLSDLQLDLLLVCGPLPMIEAVAKIAGALGIEAQLSLEQRMGCGVGACLGCAFPVKADTAEGYAYKRVCADGPVFRADEVLFSIPGQTLAGGVSR